MNKIKMIIIPVICFVLMSTCISAIANNDVYYYEDKDTTVLFSSDCELSYEKKAAIANFIVYGSPDDQISTYSWCWLLGHDKVTQTVTTIEHKVDIYEPRCIERKYLVETCNSCDYMKQTQLSEIFTYCCPED